MPINTQLLCTFSSTEELEQTLSNIKNTYDIVFDTIFVLQNVNDKHEFFCTYNINLGNISDFVIPKTISMHRKKQTNTLYTINALNSIIRKENNGTLDTSYMVDWQSYKNSIVVTDSNGIKIINTKIFKILKTKI